MFDGKSLQEKHFFVIVSLRVSNLDSAAGTGVDGPFVFALGPVGSDHLVLGHGGVLMREGFWCFGGEVLASGDDIGIENV